MSANQVMTQVEISALLDKVRHLHHLRSMRMARLTAIRKEKWINAARSRFKPGPPQACAVCGRYALVAHAHHIFPLSLQFDAGVKRPCQSYAWLCPTHHYGVHLYLNKSKEWPEDEVFGDVETERMLDIAARVWKWNLERAERKIAIAEKRLEEVAQ